MGVNRCRCVSVPPFFVEHFVRRLKTCIPPGTQPALCIIFRPGPPTGTSARSVPLPQAPASPYLLLSLSSALFPTSFRYSIPLFPPSILDPSRSYLLHLFLSLFSVFCQFDSLFQPIPLPSICPTPPSSPSSPLSSSPSSASPPSSI